MVSDKQADIGQNRWTSISAASRGTKSSIERTDRWLS
jgi:hypothetical protein